MAFHGRKSITGDPTRSGEIDPPWWASTLLLPVDLCSVSRERLPIATSQWNRCLAPWTLVASTRVAHSPLPSPAGSERCCIHLVSAGSDLGKEGRQPCLVAVSWKLWRLPIVHVHGFLLFCSNWTIFHPFLFYFFH